MKTTKIIFLLFLISSVWSCDENNLNSVSNAKKIGPPSQIAFDSLLNIFGENRFNSKNSIQKQNFYKEFDQQLNTFVDSIGLFVNWKGIIEEIDISEAVIDNYTNISCKIKYSSDDFREVTFKTELYVKTNDLKSDSIYSKLERLALGSVVYFDGIIQRDFNRNIQYENGGELLKTTKPNYLFHLLDITPYSRADTLSSKIKKIVSIHSKVFQLLKDKVDKTITNSEWSKRTKELVPRGLEEGLTENEKEYITRYKQYLYDDFMR